MAAIVSCISQKFRNMLSMPCSLDKIPYVDQTFRLSIEIRLLMFCCSFENFPVYRLTLIYIPLLC